MYNNSTEFNADFRTYFTDIDLIDNIKSTKRKKKREHKRLSFVEQPIELNVSSFIPITKTQNKAKLEFNNNNKNLFCFGSAGTGKTYLACHLALEKILNTKEFEKIIIIRSIEPTKDIGFLPGNINEKINIYEQVYYDIFNEIMKRNDGYKTLKNKKYVEFKPTSFLRGLNFRNCIVIVDECQNLISNELIACITRLGENSKIIFCGDYVQSDLVPKFRDCQKKSDIIKFKSVIDNLNEFSSVCFTHNDIVRSDLVKNFIIEAEKQNFI